MLAEFFSYNEKVCSSLDRAFIKDTENAYLENFLAEIRPEHLVADVGGGKQPARLKYPTHARNVSAYEGIDIDDTELRLAPPGTYTRTRVVDITDVSEDLFETYDRIICRNTLEHVLSMDLAMRGLAAMLKPGGKLYIKTTCRFALYARMNRMLPERLKRKVLFFLFPKKSGDGFPAYYDRCTIWEISNLASKHGFIIKDQANRMYYSSYFSFFIPVYAAWRAITGVQAVTNRDYCERFELVFEKPAP